MTLGGPSASVAVEAGSAPTPTTAAKPTRRSTPRPRNRFTSGADSRGGRPIGSSGLLPAEDPALLSFSSGPRQPQPRSLSARGLLLRLRLTRGRSLLGSRAGFLHFRSHRFLPLGCWAWQVYAPDSSVRGDGLSRTVFGRGRGEYAIQSSSVPADVWIRGIEGKGGAVVGRWDSHCCPTRAANDEEAGMDPLYELFQGVGCRAEAVRGGAKPPVAGWFGARTSAAKRGLAAIRSHRRYGMVGGLANPYVRDRQIAGRS